MDERAKATVRALLDRHPRGCVAETADFAVTNTAAGLFRLLCVAILADEIVPSEADARGIHALFGRHLDSAPEMVKSDERQRADVLRQAGHPRAEQAARHLGDAARFVIERYDGDLQRLRRNANDDPRRLRQLLAEIPGMNEPGIVIFLREAQMFWPEVAPFVDERAVTAARRLDLPSRPDELLEDVARGGGTEKLAWLVGALTLADTNDEYDRIREDARA